MFGMKLFVSENALKETDVRTFPESRHRSKRIHKKLCQRFNGEFKKVPAIWQTPQGFIVHPALEQQLRAEMNVVKSDPNNITASPFAAYR